MALDFDRTESDSRETSVALRERECSLESGTVRGELSRVLGDLRRFSGWEAREGQLGMMDALVDGMCAGGPGVSAVEAGTGTGKTMAVLAVALAMSRASGRRAVVSTRTLALMDGMLKGDLRLLSDACGGVSYCGAKGRGNYFCAKSLEGLERSFLESRTREAAWRYAAGAVVSLGSWQGDGGAWAGLFGERDCGGCPWRGDCARDVAEIAWGDAEIVVTNHTRLLANGLDMLDGACGLFVDEAHTFADAAAGAWGWRVSLDGLAKGDSDMRRLLSWAHEWLGGAVCKRRTEASAAGDRLVERRGGRAGDDVRHVAEWLGMDDARMAYWAERNAGGVVSLCAAMADVSGEMRRRVLSRVGCGFLSATLSGTGGFGGFLSSVGVAESRAHCRTFDSPFDFGSQMVLHICSSLPPPSTESGYVDGACRAVLHYARHYGGRTFVLFTGFDALETFASRLSPHFATAGLRLLKQGRDADAGALADEFRRLGGDGVVLFGGGSFWTGVDVAGDALSCVVVTRLPFPSPSDPLDARRCEIARESGGDAFGLLLDTAVSRFRQGVGRLVRTCGDIGAVVVLDSRITSMRYGQSFLDALPECRTQVF